MVQYGDRILFAYFQRKVPSDKVVSQRDGGSGGSVLSLFEPSDILASATITDCIDGVSVLLPQGKPN